jgi:hypothetical protein
LKTATIYVAIKYQTPPFQDRSFLAILLLRFEDIENTSGHAQLHRTRLPLWVNRRGGAVRWTSSTIVTMLRVVRRRSRVGMGMVRCRDVHHTLGPSKPQEGMGARWWVVGVSRWERNNTMWRRRRAVGEVRGAGWEMNWPVSRAWGGDVVGMKGWAHWGLDWTAWNSGTGRGDVGWTVLQLTNRQVPRVGMGSIETRTGGRMSWVARKSRAEGRVGWIAWKARTQCTSGSAVCTIWGAVRCVVSWRVQWACQMSCGQAPRVEVRTVAMWQDTACAWVALAIWVRGKVAGTGVALAIGIRGKVASTGRWAVVRVMRRIHSGCARPRRTA